jgi:hypothetical protein
MGDIRGFMLFASGRPAPRTIVIDRGCLEPGGRPPPSRAAPPCARRAGP